MTLCPEERLSPTDYEWSETDGILQPILVLSSKAPNDLFGIDGEENVRDSGDETIIAGDTLDFKSDDELSDSDDEPWSDDSGFDEEEEEKD